MSRQASLAEQRHALVVGALEGARREIAQRLKAARHPTTVTISELVITGNEDGTGWMSGWENRQVSALHAASGLELARDSTVPNRPIGLRPQLEELARHLTETTDLADRPAFVLPALTGVEAVLGRFVISLALRYVEQLADIGVPEPELVDRLAADLDDLCEHRVTVFQLAVNGVDVAEEFRCGDWTVRALSPRERGAIFQRRGGLEDRQPVGTDLVLPYAIDSMHAPVPTTLLQLEVENHDFRVGEVPPIHNRLALAFHLMGYDISTLGVLVYFQRPVWASQGVRHSPFLVARKQASPSKQVSIEDFQAVLSLASRIPDFGGVESSGKEVALFRTLRGCGSSTPDEAFLDFVIALEAALLGGVRDELSYRFRLYGALYLAPDRPPDETFARLKEVYEVRSGLVHGSKVKEEQRSRANIWAAELAKAVTYRAVTAGWPQRDALDAAALRWDGSGKGPPRD